MTKCRPHLKIDSADISDEFTSEIQTDRHSDEFMSHEDMIDHPSFSSDDLLELTKYFRHQQFKNLKSKIDSSKRKAKQIKANK